MLYFSVGVMIGLGVLYRIYLEIFGKLDRRHVRSS